jgi:D-beta-D-heptose 7-phosphate kinase/D-beta-D-heptose 1-phosphate adenosyltransferase
LELARLEQLIQEFRHRQVLVVGDCMLDEYLWGRVRRISPEAPVMVVEEERTSYAAGGASNVAANLVALGARAGIGAVCGADGMAALLRTELERLGVECAGVITDRDRPTTVKTRIIAHHQQVVRVDREARTPIPPAVEAALLEHIEREVLQADVVLFSDYNKGVLTERVVAGTLAAAREAGRPTLANPKPSNFWLFQGLDLVSVNQSEAEAVTGLSLRNEEELLTAGQRLLDRSDARGVLITQGGHGLSLFVNDGTVHHVPAIEQEVFDVAGAGDSVIAAAALTLASGGAWSEVGVLANCAGNAKVRKLGVVPVTPDDLRFIWQLAHSAFSNQRSLAGTRD